MHQKIRFLNILHVLYYDQNDCRVYSHVTRGSGFRRGAGKTTLHYFIKTTVPHILGQLKAKKNQQQDDKLKDV